MRRNNNHERGRGGGGREKRWRTDTRPRYNNETEQRSGKPNYKCGKCVKEGHYDNYCRSNFQTSPTSSKDPLKHKVRKQQETYNSNSSQSSTSEGSESEKEKFTNYTSDTQLQMYGEAGSDDVDSYLSSYNLTAASAESG